MAALSIRGLHKRFGHTDVLKGIDLSVESGELTVLLGPSGCGKSTLLNVIAGLERPDAGTVEIGERVVNEVPPKDRNIAMVFQSYALYPHMTVAKNIAFPLKMAGEDPKVIEKKVGDAARVLNLTNYLERRPGQL